MSRIGPEHRAEIRDLIRAEIATIGSSVDALYTERAELRAENQRLRREVAQLKGEIVQHQAAAMWKERP